MMMLKKEKVVETGIFLMPRSRRAKWTFLTAGRRKGDKSGVVSKMSLPTEMSDILERG